jgi:NitT/TauT family transport system substrate-binding protein
MSTRVGRGRARLLGVAGAAGAVALTVFGSAAASAPGRAHKAQLTTITVDTLPIANGFPLDLGIKHGFFEQQGIEIKKVTLQSGNDIVLALSNKSGEIGYVGYVPAFIARTSGIPVTIVAASDVEGTNEADNWQNILVKGSSSIRTPADLAGKTIAVNALKGVGEVMIKAALKKQGVDPNSIKLLAMPFPTMRTALANGQVDAIWTPEPFMSQALGDGARIVMAPGPVLGRFWPIGTYVALQDWARRNPGLAKGFQTAMSQSLAYAQAHPEEIRALLPAAQQNIRLPIWSPLLDRDKLLQLAKYAKEFGVITTLPNFAQLVPTSVVSGHTLQGTVGPGFTISLLQDGKPVKSLAAGSYTFVVADRSSQHNFHLAGPGVNRKTSVPKTGRSTWTVTLKKGTYRIQCDPHRSQMKGSFKVK